MITYADSSALVRLIAREPGWESVATALEGEAFLATSRVSYVECRSAIARRARERLLSASAERKASARLEALWDGVSIVELDEELMVRAGALAREAKLRTLDALQLASAERSAGRGRARFMTFDHALWKAATSARFERFPADPGDVVGRR